MNTQTLQIKIDVKVEKLRHAVGSERERLGSIVRMLDEELYGRLDECYPKGAETQITHLCAEICMLKQAMGNGPVE